MLTRVVSAWLATPRPARGAGPIRPTIAESVSRNGGSATRAPNAGSASRRISRSSGRRTGQPAASCPGPAEIGPAGVVLAGLADSASGGTRLPMSLANIISAVTKLSGKDVTGQVNITSHMDAVVTVAVRLVNALTPGEAHGRPYLPPDGAALPPAVTAALRAGRRDTREASPSEAAEFRAVAEAIRDVFDAVAGGRTGAAGRQVNQLVDRTGARPRRGPRRFCSTSCQNRVKTAAFRAAHRDQPKKSSASA